MVECTKDSRRHRFSNSAAAHCTVTHMVKKCKPGICEDIDRSCENDAEQQIFTRVPISMNADRSKEPEDCWYYLYSTCNKGDACVFRHCDAAKQNPVLCKTWESTGQCRRDCPFRHSYYHLKKKRTDDRCYWETRERGCTKEFCEFRHLDPAKDAWKEGALNGRRRVRRSVAGAERESEHDESPEDLPCDESETVDLISQEYEPKDTRSKEASGNDGWANSNGGGRGPGLGRSVIQEGSQNDGAQQPTGGWYKGRGGQEIANQGADNGKESKGWYSQERGPEYNQQRRQEQRRPSPTSYQRKRNGQEADYQASMQLEGYPSHKYNRGQGNDMMPGDGWEEQPRQSNDGDRRALHRPADNDSQRAKEPIRHSYRTKHEDDESYYNEQSHARSRQLDGGNEHTKPKAREPPINRETPRAPKQRSTESSQRLGNTELVGTQRRAEEEPRRRKKVARGEQGRQRAENDNSDFRNLDDEIAEIDDLINRLSG